MKKINISIIYLATLFMAATIISSCKKETITNMGNTGTGKYYMRFNANGVAKQLTDTFAQHSYDSLTAYGGGMIYGYDIGGTEAFGAPSLQMNVYDGYHLSANTTYKATDLLYGYQSKVSFVYIQGINAVYTSDLSEGLYGGSPTGILPDCVVTITDLSPTTAKGTFSGTVYASDDQGNYLPNNKVSITDGEFYLPVPQ